MHQAAMKKRLPTWLLIAVLAPAVFTAGWLVAEAQNADKLSLDEITANRWMGSIGLLVYGAGNLHVVKPDKTQALVRSGLDIDSATLAQLYDSMPRPLREKIAFYVPQARAIATRESGGSAYAADGQMLIFVDCVQKVRQKGGSVRSCFQDHTAGSRPARARASSIP